MVNHPKNGCHFLESLYTSFHSKSGENDGKSRILCLCCGVYPGFGCDGFGSVFLESNMNAFVFVTGALVGAYYNTAVLTVASACAQSCTKAASLILQVVA